MTNALWHIRCGHCQTVLEVTTEGINTTGIHEGSLDFLRLYCPTCLVFYEGELKEVPEEDHQVEHATEMGVEGV